MPKAKLTKRYIDAIDPTKPGLHWDTDITGYAVIVYPSAVMSYVYQYRDAQAKSHRATIGKVGALTPDEARKKAETIRRELVDGIDPLQKRTEIRNALTVNDLFDAYLASEDFKLKSEETRGTDEGRINNHLRPLLGKVLVEALTVEKAKKCIADIIAGKTAKTVKIGPRALARIRGGEGAARKSLRLLKSTLAWAKDDAKIIKVHPLEKFATGPDGEKDAILEDASEYGRVFATIADLESKKVISASAADGLRLVALTGGRRSEIAKMRWKNVDLKTGKIVLEWRNHKTGGKTGKPREIDLTTDAMAIIAKQPGREAEDFVLVPAHGVGPVDLSTPWKKVRKLANLTRADLGLHGLRHSRASHFAMEGGEAPEIMVAMGHRTLQTSMKYIHLRDAKKKAVAERAASIATAGLAISTGKPSAEITDLDQRRKDRG